MLFLHKIILYVSERILWKEYNNYEKLIIEIYDKIRDEKLQYDINREGKERLPSG